MNTVLPAPERPVTPSRTVGLNRPAPNSPSARRGEADFLRDVGEGRHSLSHRARWAPHQLFVAYDCFREPVSIPDQVRDRPFRDHAVSRSRFPACAAPRSDRAGRRADGALLQSSSAKSITASAAVGNFSIRRWRASTSPEAISRAASSADPGIVADQQQAVRRARRLLDDAEQRIRARVVDARLGARFSAAGRTPAAAGRASR